MTHARFGICNELFRGWSFARACDFAAELGYQGLEVAPMTLFDSEGKIDASRVEELKTAVAHAGLQFIGLHWLLAQTHDVHWTDPDPSVRRRTAEYLSQLAELCRSLGGDVMVLGSPKQRDLAAGMSPADGLDAARRCLELTLPALEANRVIVAVEPLGPEETNFLNTAAEAVSLIRLIDSPNIKLLLDVKAMSTESSAIPQIITDFRSELVHFHANDPNRRGPGMGSIDFVPILRALQMIDYAGWISVEVFDETPGIETLARSSIDNLRRDWPGKGDAAH